MVSTRSHPRAFPPPSSSSVSDNSSPQKRSMSPRKRDRVAIISPEPEQKQSRQKQRHQQQEPNSSPTKQAATKAVQVLTDTLASPTSKISNAVSSSAATAANAIANHASTPSVGRPRSPKPWVHTPTTLTLTWLAIAIPLVVWDALYILLRPHTLPGGRFHAPVWTPYALYGSVDKLYGAKAWRASGEGKDGVVIAHALFNLLEIVGYGAYLYMVIMASGGVSTISHSIGIGSNGSGGSSSRERSASLRSGGTKAAKAAKAAAKNSWMKPVRGSRARWAVMIGFATAVVTVSKTMMYGK